jgi:phage terminase Nu1 subunit (DNA packaging protein)
LHAQAYAAVPKKSWVQWSGRQHKVIDGQARLYGLPLDGKSIDLARLALALHEFLAANARKLAAVDRPSEEELLAGESTPALERYRAARATMAEMELDERRGALIRTERLHATLATVASVLRAAGQSLGSQYGADAQSLLDEALDDVEREIDRTLADPTGTGADPS